jgi:hypothetical protein
MSMQIDYGKQAISANLNANAALQCILSIFADVFAYLGVIRANSRMPLQ